MANKQTLDYFQKIDNDANAAVWAMRLHLHHRGLASIFVKIGAFFHGVTMKNYKEFLPESILNPAAIKANPPSVPSIEPVKQHKKTSAMPVSNTLTNDEKSMLALSFNETAHFKTTQNALIAAKKLKSGKVKIDIHDEEGDDYHFEIDNEKEEKSIISQFGQLRDISSKEYQQNLALHQNNIRSAEEQLQAVQNLLKLTPITQIKVNDIVIQKQDPQHFTIQAPDRNDNQIYSLQAVTQKISNLVKKQPIQNLEYNMDENILKRTLSRAVLENNGEPLHFRKTTEEHGKEKVLYDLTIHLDRPQEQEQKQYSQEAKKQEAQENKYQESIRNMQQVNEFMGALSIVGSDGQQMSVNDVMDIMERYALDGELHKALSYDVRTDIDEYNTFENAKDLSFEDAPHEHETVYAKEVHSHDDISRDDDDDSWMVRTLDDEDYSSYYEDDDHSDE